MTNEELAVFFQDEAKFCGCGLPEVAAKRLLDLLEVHPLFEHRGALFALIADDGFRYLMLYWIESLDLAEHGTTIDGSWLTEKGKEIQAALRREWDADRFESLFDDRCVHGYLVADIGPGRHECVKAEGVVPE